MALSSLQLLIASLPELVEHIASFLPHAHVVFCLRPLCKQTVALLSSPEYKRISVSQPCPSFAFKARWGHELALAQLSQAQRQQVLDLVAESGAIPNMECLMSVMADSYDTSSVIASAAKAGHRDMVDYLVMKGFTAENADALTLAAVNGHLEMCQHLVRTFPDTCQPNESTLQLAARGGHLPVVQWLLQKAGCPWSLDAVREAASRGHTDVLHWLLLQPQLSGDANVDAWGRVTASAAGGCNFTTFRQLLEEPWPPGPQNLAMSARYSPERLAWQQMLLAAAGSPTPDWQAKVQLLLEHPNSAMWMDSPEPGYVRCLASAARRADAVARLTWLHSAGLPLHHTLQSLCHDRRLNMEAVQLLLSHMRPQPPDQHDDAAADDELNLWMAMGACNTGCVELMSALHFAGCRFPRSALLRAAKGGHLPAVRWLRDHLPPPYCEVTAEVVVAAAYSGNMLLLRWLGLQEDADMGPGAYTAAAAAGSVQAIQWLHGRGIAFPSTGMPYLAAARHGSVFALRALAAVGCPWGPPGRVFARAVHSRRSVDVWVLEELLRLGCPVVWCGAVSAARRRGDPEVEAWVRVMHGEHQRAMAERRGGARAGGEAGVAASA